jgi:hypothetical protein
MPLAMAIAMSGACLSNVINLSKNDVLESKVKLFMSFSIFAVLIFVSLIELTLRRKKNEPTNIVKSFSIKVITGFLILVVGIFLPTVSSIELLIIILILLISNMIYGFFAWYGHEEEKLKYS